MLRFAPSPTHDMNISDLRVALFNYMVSLTNKEDLLIRIEDINKEKVIENKDKEILELLSLFSISYKYAIHQSDNIKYHSQFAMQLLMNRKAFNCFCGKEILQKEKDEAKQKNIPYMYSGFCENLSDAATFECEAPFTVRIKKPQDNSNIDSFVILNHDKTPTYNFACAIDDMLSNIDTVIRDSKYQEDTVKQIFIRDALGYDKKINYIHLASISNINKIPSVKELINEGYLPSAIVNYIILLEQTSPKEVFTLEESLEWFDINNISKESIYFDINKLKQINKQHIQDMEELRLSKILGYSDSDIGALAKLYLKECDTISQLKEKINNIFKEKNIPKELKKEINLINDCIDKAPFIKDFDEFIKYISTNTNLSKEQLSKPLNFALTNETSGVNLSKIYPLIRNYLGEIIK